MIDRLTKRLLLKVTVLYLSLLLVVIGSVLITISNKKQEFAISISNSVYNFAVTHDLRSVQRVIHPVIPSVFSMVEIIENTNSQLFKMGQASKFDIRIELNLYDLKFIFQYNVLNILYLILTFALILFMVILIFFYFERKKIDAEIRVQIKLKNAVVAESMARRLAHDIRSPLSALNAIVTAKTSIAGSTDIISAVVTRINAIADDLLIQYKKDTLSKQSDFPGESHTKKINIVPIIKNLLREKTALYADFNFELRTDNEEVLLEIEPESLTRIISNLVNNSVEASDQHKSVVIAINCFSDRTLITITDYGVGISGDVLETIGKKEITTKNNGNGIGLYSTFRQMEAWNGSCKVVSKPGIGTQVSLTFNSSASLKDTL
ncbi:sensor histidine kinase [Bdellovibrio reynosensis]|uniref:histidine kinase n=1 Tax=Bdellovibrio reynosensis TaxID=2835041 RepID=A0ABY4C698_9BACT|nr:ATP-binding protein [Bdellovibrio reynosensis]UOF00420.1 ATP-binding protein [Bdellovibrio reynosensis]